MASKNYSYPRVTMSTVAKKHSHNRVNVPDTTILFAPLWTEKGPDDQVVKVHSLAEFIDIFGSLNEDFYNYNGQQALNVYNWLNNGGTLLVKRLIMGHYEGEGTSRKFVIDDIKAKSEELNYYSANSGDFNLDPDTGIVLNSTGKALRINNNTYSIYNNDATLVKSYIRKITDDSIYKDYEHIDGGVYSKEVDGKTLTLSLKELYEYIKNKDIVLIDGVLYNVSSFPTNELKSFTVSTRAAVKAKYYGSYYKGLKLEVTRVGKKDNTGYFNFLIKKDKLVVEKFLQKTLKTYLTALSASEYISIEDLDLSQELAALTNSTASDSFTIELSEGTAPVYSYEKVCTAIEEFFTNKTKHPLANRLETPIDIILDAGYNNTIKSAIANFIRNNSEESLRPDIIGIFDRYELRGKLNKVNENTLTDEGDLHGDSAAYTPTNIALYEQYFTINDATFTGQNIYVTPTYFLSKLLPYNDNTYGMQYPTAGLRRGILDDALAVSKNPDEAQKDKWFKARINYVEKTSREYAFMSQRTFDGSDDYEYTALSFLNNARVLEKMKKELEAIGRSYLHEFNDAVTIANMTVALNKYVANWISNRTLSMGVVEVVQNEVSENALDINLTIRFTNTIEVINVSIVIE